MKGLKMEHHLEFVAIPTASFFGGMELLIKERNVTMAMPILTPLPMLAEQMPEIPIVEMELLMTNSMRSVIPLHFPQLFAEIASYQGVEMALLTNSMVKNVMMETAEMVMAAQIFAQRSVVTVFQMAQSNVTMDP